MTITKAGIGAIAAVFGFAGGTPGLAAGPVKDIDVTRAAIAELAPTRGNEANGTVVFVDDIEGRTAVHVSLAGLTPGSTHGLHVHETGDCSAPDASSAGGHFNPTGAPHGGRDGTKRHAGDLGNVTADVEGIVKTRFTVPKLAIGSGNTDVLERGVILHGNADDLTSQPSGNAGPRIACGVVRRGTADDES